MKQQKHTPGPWRFEVNEKAKTVDLCGGRVRHDLTVIDFVRWGMGGAQPRFRDDVDDLNIMCQVTAFTTPAEGREHHAGWFKIIDHPDARLIESAPELLDSVETLLGLLCEYIRNGTLAIGKVANAHNTAAELLMRNGRVAK